MSFYQDYVMPRLTHLAMRQKQLAPFRRHVIGAAEGRVLEVGIGSGLNLPLLTSASAKEAETGNPGRGEEYFHACAGCH
jgi:mono/diheme cytochrome c family protein